MTSKPEDVDEEQDDLASGPRSTRLANDLRGVRRLAGWGSGDGEQTGGGPPKRSTEWGEPNARACGRSPVGGGGGEACSRGRFWKVLW